MVAVNEFEADPAETTMVTPPVVGGAVYMALALPVPSVLTGSIEKLPPALPSE